MASVRIFWDPAPNATALAAYQVFRSTSASGTWWLLGCADVTRIGVNWEGTRGQHVFEDVEGSQALFYKVVGVDAQGVARATSVPFQPTGVQASALTSRVRIDADYGGTDALRYVDTGGAPISQAEIRVFRQVDYLRGQTSVAVASTMTRVDGRWETPLYLPAGLSYVIQFYKASSFGPTAVTITV